MPPAEGTDASLHHLQPFPCWQNRDDPLSAHEDHLAVLVGVVDFLPVVSYVQNAPDPGPFILGCERQTVLPIWAKP